MANIKIEKKGRKNVITISGEMTIENAAALKDALIHSLKNVKHIVMDLDNITDMDLSCLQLLCSAHRTSAGAQKTLELKSGYPEVLKRAAREAGYLRNSGCTLETEDGCLWKRI
jgi:anti-anti-sigma factor